jgi:hypothetical protein
MIYSVHLYTVDRVRLFVATFREGGLWHRVARSQLGFINSSVLERQSSARRSSEWLVIHFWKNEEAYARARQSPSMALFLYL